MDGHRGNEQTDLNGARFMPGGKRRRSKIETPATDRDAAPTQWSELVRAGSAEKWFRTEASKQIFGSSSGGRSSYHHRGQHTAMKTIFAVRTLLLLCSFVGSTLPRRQEEPPVVPAMNWLDQDGEYFHHPVLAALFRLGHWHRLRAPEYTVEFGGLLVPAGFDCDVFNQNDGLRYATLVLSGMDGFEHPLVEPGRIYPYARWVGSFPSYFMAVPSRWIWCWQQHAAMESALRFFPESLPCIDEEYPEYVAWAHSAMRARTKFVGIELGTRWGSWGARAVTFLRVLNSTLPYDLLYVESNAEHCAGLERVHEINGIENYTLVCDVARPENILPFISRQSRVDILDIHIAFEYALLRNTGLRRMLQDRVVRLVIGTHSTQIHESIKWGLVNEGWLLISEVPFTSNTSCLNRYRNPVGRQKSPEELMKNGCYHEHPVFGPIAQHDGSLIFDNPTFVSDNTDLEFRFESANLLVNDLIVTEVLSATEVNDEPRQYVWKDTPS